ncbi:hypothetical protein HanRHA438_Chr08g0372491 [Helianthus annuus]|nr:hypothetical protein HanIR_Chr08g0389301 [Helianthus annuus]KAJ0899777.1 hypothetical protein HanRHA438_Chr08g0372491 [Helianthus annuus]
MFSYHTHVSFRPNPVSFFQLNLVMRFTHEGIFVNSKVAEALSCKSEVELTFELTKMPSCAKHMTKFN